jgi:tRNA pseudouridine55 synthase
VDGLLVVDKPTGPTSHDIVATARRVLGEKRIGHTGTLDPLASGVLPLVLGRATRLAQFLTSSEKAYDATVRLGVTTDTADRLGAPVGAAYDGPWPTREAIERALERFRGVFEQRPPVYSAKKIEGRRSHRLARANARRETSSEAPPRPAAVTVTTTVLELVAVDGPLLSLRIVCTAGFYVRALAADLGDALGTGAHLSELRRTRSGRLGLEEAVPFEALVAATSPAMIRVIPLEEMLPDMPAIALTPDGLRRILHGQDVGPEHTSGPWPIAGEPATASTPGVSFRLRGPGGELVAIADRSGTPGLLHPAVVLK